MRCIGLALVYEYVNMSCSQLENTTKREIKLLLGTKLRGTILIRIENKPSYSVGQIEIK